MSITAKKVPPFVRGIVHNAYSGYCACKRCYNKADELHHIKSNSKSNNEKWKRFMQSPFNLVPLCRKCHDGTGMYEFSISDRVADMYEEYLQEMAMLDHIAGLSDGFKEGKKKI